MNYKEHIDSFEDFPKEGILFKDISSIIADSKVFGSLIRDMAVQISSLDFDTIVALDARGFVFGSALAFYLNRSLVMARKAGKLPGEVVSADYALEYGTDSVEIQIDKVRNRKVLIVDDLLATGGTVSAVVESINKAGGSVVGILVAIELLDLKGRDKVDGVPVMSVVKY